MAMKPYLLNVTEKVAHKRPTHEECNADQIVRKRNADKVPVGYRECEHCCTAGESPYSESNAGFRSEP